MRTENKNLNRGARATKKNRNNNLAERKTKNNSMNQISENQTLTKNNNKNQTITIKLNPTVHKFIIDFNWADMCKKFYKNIMYSTNTYAKCK